MKNQQIVHRPTAGHPPAEPVARPAIKRNRRRSWSFWLVSRLLVVMLILGVLAFFAPMLIGRAGFWKQLVAVAAPGIAQQVDIASLQLGWFSPIEIRGLAVRDNAGQ